MKMPSFSKEFSEDQYSLLTTALNDFFQNVGLDNFGGQTISNISIPQGQRLRISHSLKVVPQYRIILRQTGNGVISDGDWNSNFIELINNSSDETVILTVFLGRT